jgi:hypothetical protein
VSAQDVNPYPRDRGQVRMMREAGLSIHDLALYFGASESAVERTLEEQRAERGPETLRELTVGAPAEQWKQHQARAVELAHSVYRLLGMLCQHPAHGRGSAMEAGWDLADEICWLLDPADDRPVPRVREARP